MNWRFKKKASRLNLWVVWSIVSWAVRGIKATGVYLNVPLGELRFVVRVDDGGG